MSDSSPAGFPERLPWGVCLWLAGVVLWTTWAPFLPRDGPWELVTSMPDELLEVTGNIALFFPLTFVVGRSAAAPSLDRRTTAVLAAGLLAACGIVEGGQILIADRLVSPYDFGLNLSGGFLGLLAGRAIAGTSVVRRRMYERGFIGLLLLIYLAVAAIVVSRIPAARHGLQLRSWNGSYPVRVADEVGGDRPYRGTVSDARLCAGTGADAECASEGSPLSVRRELARLAETTQSILLEARVRSRSSQQYGPTRVITFSEGPGARNATLGQSGDDLVLRLRTPMGGSNGTEFLFRLRDVLAVGEDTRVAARYADGVVRLRAEREREVKERTFRATGTWILTWLIAGGVDQSFGLQMPLALVSGTILILLPGGLLAGWASRPEGPIMSGLVGALLSGLAMGAVIGGLGSVSVTVPALLASLVGALGGLVGHDDRRVWCGRYTGGAGR